MVQNAKHYEWNEWNVVQNAETSCSIEKYRDLIPFIYGQVWEKPYVSTICWGYGMYIGKTKQFLEFWPRHSITCHGHLKMSDVHGSQATIAKSIFTSYWNTEQRAYVLLPPLTHSPPSPTEVCPCFNGVENLEQQTNSGGKCTHQEAPEISSTAKAGV